MSGALSGRAIVVTRPERQAGPIAALLRDRGAEVVVFPTIAIEPQLDREPARHIATQLTDFDAAIFVSVNAVEQGLACVAAHGSWPATLLAIAVGPSTAAALRAAGASNVVMPATGHDSEGVIALPELARPAGRRYVVFRGVGGRDWLVEELRRRGAVVEVAEVYIRTIPPSDAAELRKRWAQGGVAAVVVASSEALANLRTMIGPSAEHLLQRTPTVVTHARIAAYARSLGLTTLLESSTGDAAIVDSLCTFFAKVRPDPSEDERS